MIILFLATFCSGCAGPPKYAHVVNGWNLPAKPGSTNYYVVQKGETLYSIAWAFDMDFRELAAANHLKPPYAISRGQRLSMTPADVSVTATPASPSKKSEVVLWVNKVKNSFATAGSSSSAAVNVSSANGAAPSLTKNVTVQNVSRKKSLPVKYSKDVSRPVGCWLWPANGKVLHGFAPQKLRGNKGLDIAGSFGEPIKASAAGRVVYAGSGLRGYGNLIIIKHNDTFLSAYAHNRRLLVHEGQAVKAAQKIAEMGQADTGVVMLHFEIRRNGKPVDPAGFLIK